MRAIRGPRRSGRREPTAQERKICVSTGRRHGSVPRKQKHENHESRQKGAPWPCVEFCVGLIGFSADDGCFSSMCAVRNELQQCIVQCCEKGDAAGGTGSDQASAGTCIH